MGCSNVAYIPMNGAQGCVKFADLLETGDQSKNAWLIVDGIVWGSLDNKLETCWSKDKKYLDFDFVLNMAKETALRHDDLADFSEETVNFAFRVNKGAKLGHAFGFVLQQGIHG